MGLPNIVKELKVEQAEGARFYHQGLMVVCLLEHASAKENEQTNVNMWGCLKVGDSPIYGSCSIRISMRKKVNN